MRRRTAAPVLQPAPLERASADPLRGSASRARNNFVRVPVRSIREAADVATSGAVARLPHFDAIQQSFGRHDLSSVAAHLDTRAAAGSLLMGAEAFTTGRDVAFSRASTLHTAAHEAAHAVQQRAGIGGPADRHEHHADAVARRVVAGQSAEPLLDAYGAANRTAPADGPVQMTPKASHYGRFIDTTYKLITDGVEMHLEFEPNAKVDASAIGLVQSVKAVGAGKAVMTDPTQESRFVSSGMGSGYRIDRVTSRNNPIYGAASLGIPQTLGATAKTNAPAGATPSTANATYELGHHFVDAGTPKSKNAWLYDSPTSEAPANSGMTFETAAVAIAGAQTGTYYGSVKWGWERDASNVLKAIDFDLVSEAVPSQNFLAPAAKWNTATTRGTLVARNQPTQVWKMSGSAWAPDFTIPKDTVVTATGMVGALGEDRQAITLADGRSGFIKVPDLLDKGDGSATFDLPVQDVHVIKSAKPVVLNDQAPGPWAFFTPVDNGTRVVLDGRTTTSMDTPPEPMRWARVVQGPKTGSAGYVREREIVKENP